MQEKKRKRERNRKSLTLRKSDFLLISILIDLNTKINAARKFIEKGSKVKVSMRFRGRGIAFHTEGSMHVLTDFAKELGEYCR